VFPSNSKTKNFFILSLISAGSGQQQKLKIDDSCHWLLKLLCTWHIDDIMTGRGN